MNEKDKMIQAVNAYIKDSAYDVRDCIEVVLQTLKQAAANEGVDDAMWSMFLTDTLE